MDIKKEIEKTTKVIVSDLLYINNRKINFTPGVYILENEDKKNFFVFIKVDKDIFPTLPTNNIYEELEGLRKKIKLKSYSLVTVLNDTISFVIPYDFEKNILL